MKDIEKTLNEELRNNDCIENLVNAIDSQKSLYDAFVVDGKLVVVFNDELETNEVEKMQTMLKSMDGCGEVFSDEFELGYKENFKSLTLDLLTDNVSIGKFEQGGEVEDDFYEVYDDETGKSLMIQAIDQNHANSISERIDFEAFEDGDELEYGWEDRFAKGGEVAKYKNFEIVVISNELNKDGGRNFKDRILVSATNVKEAKKIATKLWKERINDESDLMMLEVLTDSELKQSKKYAKGGNISQGGMYSIELDTNNIDDDEFQKYLKSNSIIYKVISTAKGTSYSQDDSIKYVGKKEALMSMIDDYFAGTQQDSIEAYKEIKKMAKGGNVNKISTTNQVKRNLRGSGAFTLELEMAVYVPSTTFADQIISKTLFQKRIQEVEKYLSKLFGGYSSTAIDGGYVSKEKGLIKEDAAKVTAFGTEEAIKKNFKPLMRQISKWCESWGQESMGFEFEGDLYYVEKNAKFSKGGKIDKKPKFVKNAKK